MFELCIFIYNFVMEIQSRWLILTKNMRNTVIMVTMIFRLEAGLANLGHYDLVCSYSICKQLSWA